MDTLRGMKEECIKADEQVAITWAKVQKQREKAGRKLELVWAAYCAAVRAAQDAGQAYDDALDEQEGEADNGSS
jgi:hypothetical protein